MGFGILFIGYFITYVLSMNTVGVVFRILGYAIMCKATLKLSEYDVKFKTSAYLSLSLVFINALGATLELVSFLYDNMVISSNPFSGVRWDIVTLYVEPLVVLAFHILLLLAIRSIAKDTDMPKIVASAGRNIFFIGLYYLLSFLRYLLPPAILESYNENMSLPMVLLYLVWIFFNHALLISCYSHICDEADFEMTPKRSRIAFLNKYMDALEKKRERSRQEDEKYRREKLEKLKNKKK